MEKTQKPRTPGDRLKELRGHDSQQKMADITGVSRQAWHLWETNQRKMPHTNAIKLTKKFNITLDWIYLG